MAWMGGSWVMGRDVVCGVSWVMGRGSCSF